MIRKRFLGAALAAVLLVGATLTPIQANAILVAKYNKKTHKYSGITNTSQLKKKIRYTDSVYPYKKLSGHVQGITYTIDGNDCVFTWEAVPGASYYMINYGDGVFRKAKGTTYKANITYGLDGYMGIYAVKENAYTIKGNSKSIKVPLRTDTTVKHIKKSVNGGGNDYDGVDPTDIATADLYIAGYGGLNTKTDRSIGKVKNIKDTYQTDKYLYCGYGYDNIQYHKMTWNKVSKADYYEIEGISRKSANDDVYTDVVNETIITNKNFIPLTTVTNSLYYDNAEYYCNETVRIRAVREKNGKLLYGKWTKINVEDKAKQVKGSGKSVLDPVTQKLINELKDKIEQCTKLGYKVNENLADFEERSDETLKKNIKQSDDLIALEAHRSEYISELRQVNTELNQYGYHYKLDFDYSGYTTRKIRDTLSDRKNELELAKESAEEERQDQGSEELSDW